MENERTKKNFKVMLVCMSIVICCFLLTGIVLTFVLKSKQGNLAATNNQNTQLEQEYKELKDQQDYKDSDQYADDYYQYEEGYGNDGDIVIELK